MRTSLSLVLLLCAGGVAQAKMKHPRELEDLNRSLAGRIEARRATIRR